MGKSQRNKGAGFEREVCDIFTAALGLDEEHKIKRNIGQARDGGNDIDIGPLVVECKRRKTLGTVYGWLQQAIDATKGKFVMPRKGPHAGDPQYGEKMLPVVVAREDNGVPIVIMRLNDFLMLTNDELRAHYEDAA